MPQPALIEPLVTLQHLIAHDKHRRSLADDAVAEAGAAVRERNGFGGLAARAGLDSINVVRPGFLERQIYELLPALIGAIEPHWVDCGECGSERAHLESNADQIAEDLLAVTDTHASQAQDARAVAVYERLRTLAPDRIAGQMPRIAAFVDRQVAAAG